MRPNDELELEIEITKVVGVLAASFPTVQMSADSINAYVRMLKDVPLDVLTLTVEQCIAESKFLPSIAELRNKAFELVSNVSQIPTPFEAWEIVAKEMRRIGMYKSPSFDNRLIAKAVECIGWRELCTSENQIADRAHFVRVYENLLQRAITEAKTLPAVRAFRETGAPLVQLVDGNH